MTNLLISSYNSFYRSFAPIWQEDTLKCKTVDCQQRYRLTGNYFWRRSVHRPRSTLIQTWCALVHGKISVENVVFCAWIHNRMHEWRVESTLIINFINKHFHWHSTDRRVLRDWEYPSFFQILHSCSGHLEKYLKYPDLGVPVQIHRSGRRHKHQYTHTLNMICGW